MLYIQRKGKADLLETVDEFETKEEAERMLAEYQLADLEGKYYISKRPCREWTEIKGDQ